MIIFFIHFAVARSVTDARLSVLTVFPDSLIQDLRPLSRKERWKEGKVKRRGEERITDSLSSFLAAHLVPCDGSTTMRDPETG